MVGWGSLQVLVTVMFMAALRRVQSSGLSTSLPVTSVANRMCATAARAYSGGSSDGLFPSLMRSGTFHEEWEKMRSFRNKGLIIVSDFDRTITSYIGKDGLEKGEECHDIIFNHVDKSPEWMARVDKLWEDTRTLYGPMEELSEERKNSFCDWWWAEANSIMMSRRLTRDEVKQAAKISNTVIRPGFLELVSKCRDVGVPFVVVSAGFSDVIEGIFEREGVDPGSVVVHANRMRFDQHGVLEGFDDPLVHSRNKALFSRHIPPQIQPMLQGGARMLVMGDKLHDLDAVVNIEGACSASLKVGFATPLGNEEELLEKYHAVVPGDGPMHLVFDMLEGLWGDKVKA